MTDEPKRAGLLARVKLIVLLVVLFLAIIIIFQNNQKTPYAVLFWTVELPRYLLPLFSLCLGVLAGLVAGRFAFRKRR
jgi:uncharacterized integral membrane protein